MKTIIIKDIETFKTIADNGIKKKAIFRGINSRDYLFPKIMRDGGKCIPDEYHILESFESHYGVYANTNKCWEFMALAEHYGLMTRLLDFTYNPYVALFFALYSKHKEGEKYQILAIEPNDISVIEEPPIQNIMEEKDENDLNAISLSFFMREFLLSASIQEEFEKLKDGDKVFAVIPYHRDKRILMQQGLFIIPAVLTEKSVLGMYNRFATRYIIDDLIRDELVNYLDALGFNEFRMMPDLESVCFEINHHFKEKR